MTQQHPPTADSADDKPKRSLSPRSIRGRVVAGILLIIPIFVTLWLVGIIYRIALSTGSWLLNMGTAALNYTFKYELKGKFDPADATWYESVLAVVLTVVMLYMIGWLGANAVGRRIIEFAENLFERIPFVDTVYSSLKRMVRALSNSDNPDDDAKRVVLIDFPSDNMMAMALMTNIITDSSTGKRYATVFVPTTPNPTSGYMEIVPLERVTPTDMSVQMGLSTIISGGAAAPPRINFLKRGSLAEQPTPAIIPPPAQQKPDQPV